MNPVLALLLSILLPVIPWISLVSWWVVKRGSILGIWLLLVCGIFLDLWWARPLGGTSLLLSLMAVGLYFGARAWPASFRSFAPIALIFSLVIFEVYLAL